jgi:RNA ligase
MSGPTAYYPQFGEIHPYIARGLIRRESGSARANARLAIYSYTDLCQSRRIWDRVTRRCRGLILDDATGRVVARPFDKFFALDEMPESSLAALPWDSEAIVTDKVDGMLGILYYHRRAWHLAAYWTFESTVADFARAHLLPSLALDRLDRQYTYLFEIVQRNKVFGVLTYDYDGLVLIGRRHLKTGVLDWPASLAAIAAQIGALPPPVIHVKKALRDYVVRVRNEGQGREGVFVRFANGLMIKVVNREYQRRFDRVHSRS